MRFPRLKGKTVFLMHSLADVDAVASAIVLARHYGGEAALSDSLDSQAKRVLEELDVARPPKLKSLEGVDNVVLVDCSNYEVLGKKANYLLNGFEGRVLAVDHHIQPDSVAGIIDAKAGSTAEIVTKLVKQGPREAELLLCGIISDTHRFESSGPETFKRVIELLEKGASYRKCLKAVQKPPSLEEQKDLLQGLKKAKVKECNGYLYALSSTFQHQLHCAALLVKAGCAYAAVTGKGRMSVAKRADAPGKAAELCEKLGEALNGDGGGHELVGGVSFPKEKITEAEALKKTGKEIKLLLSNDNL
jgi:nanoRNase/pAp phosphatase (c-di-AMP/oligoRNAs hydrolase)